MVVIRVGFSWCAALFALTAVGCGLNIPSAEPTSGFVVSREEFDTAFPNRNPFYTYDDLVAALPSYPAFANTGDDATRRREAAAFLGNVYHETGGLAFIEESVGRRSQYCDAGWSFGCPAGKDAYFGRGPAQLSWNYNYHAAGNALGVDLLTDPALIEHDPLLAWRTALWFWNTQAASAAATPHNAMMGDLGFGETIRAFDGVLECDGRNPGEVQSRVDAYLRISKLLGVSPGGKLDC
jgi:Chitinase class I